MKISYTLFLTAMVAIVVERCRAEYLLVAVDDDDFRTPKNDGDDIREPKNEDDIRKQEIEELGPGKNTSDAIVEQDDSLYSRDLNDGNCKSSFKDPKKIFLFNAMPTIIQWLLRGGKFMGWDKVPLNPELKIRGVGTIFFDVIIEGLYGVKFEDACMTPKDRNMKKEYQVTLVFPRLDLTGKLHWSKKLISLPDTPAFPGIDLRFESDIKFSGALENVKVRIGFPMDVSGKNKEWKLHGKFEKIKEIDIRPTFEMKDFERDGFCLGKIAFDVCCDLFLSVLSNSCTTGIENVDNIFKKWIADRQFLHKVLKNSLNEMIVGRNLWQVYKEMKQE